MKRSILAATLGLAALGVVQPARAVEAPWCAVIDLGRGDAYWDCQYQTIQQCAPVVLGGNRGFCNPNPAYSGPIPPPPRKVHHRRHRRH